MITDKFLITDHNIEKTLARVERIASCYFKTKELLQVRLLTEETISVIRPALKISEGRVWITTSPDKFEVTVDCSTDANGITEQTKKDLLGLSSSDGNTGVFGAIGKILNYLVVSGEEYNMLVGENLIVYDVCHISGYTWNYNVYPKAMIKELDSTPPTEPEAEPDKEKELEERLEMRIVEGYADDIKVFVRKATKGKQGAKGPRLEITFTKNMTETSADDIQF